MKNEKSFPQTVRGTMKRLNDEGDLEFRAYRETGEKAQEVIVTTGGGKLYRTTGKKNPQMVAHLTAKCSDADPIATMYGQLDRLARTQRTKAPAAMRGTRLLDEPTARVVLNSSMRRIELTLGIDLTQTPNYQNQLITLMQKVSACLLINHQKVASAIPAPPTSSRS